MSQGDSFRLSIQKSISDVKHSAENQPTLMVGLLVATAGESAHWMPQGFLHLLRSLGGPSSRQKKKC